MVRVEHFWQDNRRLIYDIRSLENITVSSHVGTCHSKLNKALHEKYMELLHKFENRFPKIITATHFLYWSFIRTKIAKNYLEMEDTFSANEIVYPCVNSYGTCLTVDSLIQKMTIRDSLEAKVFSSSEIVLFNMIAGVLQILFNVLAVIHVTNITNKQSFPTHKDPMHWLSCAQKVYKLYTQRSPSNTGPEFLDTLLNSESNWIHEFQESGGLNKQNLSMCRLMLEHEYTKTIFLVAQVHQLVGKRAQSADYCQLTLLRQLKFCKSFKKAVNSPFCLQNIIRIKSAHSLRDLENRKLSKRHPCYHFQTFDPIEWATNAVALSDYFSSVENQNNCYYKTFECLLSAIHVVEEARLEGNIPSSQIDSTLANIYRDLVKISLDLLEKGTKQYGNLVDEKLTSEDAEFKKSEELQNVTKFGSMFNLELQPIMTELLDYNFNVKSSISNVIPWNNDFIYKLVRPPTNYETASGIFRIILNCIMKAENFYTLQNHCIDAIGLIQDRSKAYRLMAVFEKNISRQCCMHKRRIDMLNNVLGQLNPNHYLHLCRQLTFELAEALSTLRDLKRKLLDEIPLKEGHVSAHYARKSDDLTKRAISVYRNFLELYGVHSGTTINCSDDDIKPLIVTCLHTARLYSQLISTCTAEKIQNLTKALEFYVQLVALAENHIQRDVSTAIKDCEELRIAKEMVVLIPVKLTRLSRGEILPD
uniref:KIF-binding protein n=1 Tax=Schistosoma mansoni TaxID=6183 RepID=A0A3Q0KU13_SCHMA